MNENGRSGAGAILSASDDPVRTYNPRHKTNSKTKLDDMNINNTYMMKSLNYAALALSFALTGNVSPLAARNGDGGKHEALVHVGGGMTVPVTGPRDGGMTGDDFGTNIGAGYAYNLTSRFALMSGVEYSNYSGRISYATLTDGYTGRDYEVTPPRRLTYDYRIDNYRETQTFSLVSVPLMLRYGTELDDNTSLYFAGGCKLGFPVTARAKISGKLVSSANFDHENVIYSNLPGHDFFDGENFGAQANKIETKTAAILSLESGLRFSLGRVLFYAALNFDYSLNSIKRASDKHPLNFVETGLLCESLLNTSFTDQLRITGFGLKVGVGLQ